MSDNNYISGKREKVIIELKAKEEVADWSLELFFTAVMPLHPNLFNIKF